MMRTESKNKEKSFQGFPSQWWARNPSWKVIENINVRGRAKSDENSTISNSCSIF